MKRLLKISMSEFCQRVEEAFNLRPKMKKNKSMIFEITRVEQTKNISNKSSKASNL